MAKQLKSRSDKNDKDFDLKRDDEQSELTNNVVESSITMDGSNLAQIIKRLKERDKYFDDYEEFLNSKKDGAFVEHDPETGKTTIYVKAETPQEAMDKLNEFGFISKEESELFKSRFDELEAQGVDVSQIRGGDLSVLRDDKLFDEFSKMALEAQEKGEPLSVYDRSIVEASMKQRELDSVSRETSSSGPDVQVAKSLSDQELLTKLANAEMESGVSGPDAIVGKPNDMEYGD